MSDILRITQAVTPKNYTMPSKPLAESDAIFNLVDLSKVVKTADRTEQFKQDNNTNLSNHTLLENSLKLATSTSFTSDTLKDLINGELLSLLQQSGAIDFAEELNSFTKSIFLSSENIVADIELQQEGITYFKGEMFTLLREAYSNATSEDVKQAILTLLKSISTLQSQDEILNSLSSNFKFMSESLFPSRTLSNDLFDIAKAFSRPDAAENFIETKQLALAVLKQVEGSLLLTDKIKNMIPLITHNLSRYNDNPLIVLDNLKALLSHLSSGDEAQALKNAFENFVQSSHLPQSSKDALLSTSQGFADADKLAIAFAKEANLHSSQINITNLTESLEVLSNSIPIQSLNAEGEPFVSVENGTLALKDMLMTVLPKHLEGDVSKFLSVFSQTKDLNTLITRLSFILNKIDEADIKSLLAKNMNIVLTSLTKSPEVFYKPPTSMQNLVDFISKNLTNHNTELLGLVDPNTLVQNMLVSPGVFTPLLHFFMPLQEDETRAIGELWVDPDGEQSAYEKDGEHSHLFLTFSIEDAGEFELEIFEIEKKLGINLYCPKELILSFSSVKNSIQKIAEANGYSVQKSTISPLTKRRNLTDVFPKLAQRRAGLDVKI